MIHNSQPRIYLRATFSRYPKGGSVSVIILSPLLELCGLVYEKFSIKNFLSRTVCNIVRVVQCPLKTTFF